MSAQCPTPEQLEQFVLGKLLEPELARVAGHAERCVSCQAALATLDEQQDELLARLRRRPGKLSGTEPDRANDVDLRTVEAEAETVATTISESQDRMNRLLGRLEGLSGQDHSPPSGDWMEWARSVFGPSSLDEPVRVGSYRLERVLGVGGMGIVFDAYDERLDRRVAWKVMRPEIAAEVRVHDRFLVESRAMAAVVHERVVKVFQIGEASGLPFVAMEFLQGESLAQRMRRGPAFTVSEAVLIGHQIAEGLSAAHQRGLIHRDVKPENVFLVESRVERRETSVPDKSERSGASDSRLSTLNSRLSVKLLDFGLAYHASGASVTAERGWVLGTPAYMSPEQAQAQPVDERSDLFSLGCVLYRMLAGRLPFDGSTPRALLAARLLQSPMSLQLLAPLVPQELTTLIDQLLAKDPQRRPASAREIVERLAPLLPPVSRPSLSRWTCQVGVALVVGALALVIGLSRGHWTGLSRPTHEPSDTTVTSSAANLETEALVTNTVIEKPKPAPLDAAWLARVSKLEAEEQVQEVVAEMRRRNPGWDGEHQTTLRRGQVVRFHFESGQVADLSPVRAFSDLETLYCVDRDKLGTLVNFSPLEGLSLVDLDCGYTGLRDLSPLRNMPLRVLRMKSTQVQDLQPLSDMPLRVLQMAETPVEDLTPIKDCPLSQLSFWKTKVSDLSPLRGMQTLERLECEHTLVSDLSPLQGLRLKHLCCEGSPIKDYSLLREFPLEFLNITYQPEIHRELLRSIPMLQKINYKPVAEVLK